MHTPSSSSVKIFWLDSRKTIEEVTTAVRQMKAQRPEIEEVWLFGSLARGDAAPGSDADLLVILSSSAEHFLDRIPRYLLTGLSLGVDVFPYTRAEVEQMLIEGNLFLGQIIKEAVKLA